MHTPKILSNGFIAGKNVIQQENFSTWPVDLIKSNIDELWKPCHGNQIALYVSLHNAIISDSRWNDDLKAWTN